jgi:hypothetical protein
MGQRERPWFILVCCVLSFAIDPATYIQPSGGREGNQSTPEIVNEMSVRAQPSNFPNFRYALGFSFEESIDYLPDVQDSS